MNCPTCNDTKYVNSVSSYQVSYPIPCECSKPYLDKKTFNKLAFEIYNLVPVGGGGVQAWQLLYDLTEAYDRLESLYLAEKRLMEVA